ncbi:hypothetical protein CVT26_007142 [Gymnopilus dilepis]|uniref:Uncharacterized protein n=1 Tax=Gymnopilus dilepis TaxID=231916 RepID=A0A409W0E7_9AGAR|nr:hypothetical protein CVT26_007142 [Gymnopilus dilepis]
MDHHLDSSSLESSTSDFQASNFRTSSSHWSNCTSSSSGVERKLKAKSSQRHGRQKIESRTRRRKSRSQPTEFQSISLPRDRNSFNESRQCTLIIWMTQFQDETLKTPRSVFTAAPVSAKNPYFASSAPVCLQRSEVVQSNAPLTLISA